MPSALDLSQRPVFSPWLALISAVAAVVLYLGVMDNTLLPADLAVTVQSPLVVGAPGAGSAWLAPTPTSETTLAHRPVLVLLLRGERGAWGGSPSSWHGTNIVLLALLLLALQLWAGRLLRHPGATWVAVLTFALHPMCGQAVRTVEGQGLLFALTAVLAGLWIAQLWREGALRPAAAGPLLAFCALLAAGTHELGYLLPLWVALQWAFVRLTLGDPLTTPGGRTVRRRAGASQRELPRLRGAALAWLTLPTLAAFIALLVLRLIALDRVFPPAASDATPWSAAGHVAVAYALGIWRVLWPIHPTLVWDPWNEAGRFPAPWLGWLVLATTAAAILLPAFAGRWRRTSLGLALTFTALLAVALLPVPGIFSERPLLFALPGFCLAVAALLRHLAPAWSFPPRGWPARAMLALLALAWIAMAVQTWARGGAWQDVESLWLAEAGHHPQSPAPLFALFEDFAQRGQPARAEAILDRLRPLAVQPAELDRLAGLEVVLAANADDLERLDDILRDELAAERKHGVGHMLRLGLIAQVKGLDQLAPQLLAAELDHYPDSFGALYELAELERRAARLDRAIRFASRAVETAPDDLRRARALERHGSILADSGRTREAAHELRTALELDETLYDAYVTLARIYWGLGEITNAEIAIQRGFRLGRTQSHVDLATVYVSMLEDQGRVDTAVVWLESTMKQFPTDLQLIIFAGHYMVEVGRYELARQILQPLAMQTTGRPLAEVLNALAMLEWFGAGNETNARTLVRQSLTIAPDLEEPKRLLDVIDASKSAPAPAAADAPSTATLPAASDAPSTSALAPAPGLSLGGAPPDFVTTGTAPVRPF